MDQNDLGKTPSARSAARGSQPLPAVLPCQPHFCQNPLPGTLASLTPARHSPLPSIRRFTPKNGEKRGTEGTGQVRQVAPCPALTERAVHVQADSRAREDLLGREAAGLIPAAGE